MSGYATEYTLACFVIDKSYGVPVIVKTQMNGTGEAYQRMMTRMTNNALPQKMMSW